MENRLKVLVVLILVAFNSGKPLFVQDKINRFDIVVYGGTSAGIAAAIQSSRMGKSVVLIEPSNRIGGLTTGGLGQTDIGNKQAIGGISREFYQNIKKYYEDPENWRWQEPEQYQDGGQTRTEEGEETMWTFEPSAALKVFREMLAREKVELVYNERLNRKNGVQKNGVSIEKIVMESGEGYRGKMFIDATYEGDLMATAGVSYTVGREANDQYGETLNGVQANDLNLSLKKDISYNGANHNFVDGVDPYIIKGKKSSGLLPYVLEGGPGFDGDADNKIQAYCFRMTLTDHPDNRVIFEKPAGYDELDYELLIRNYEAGESRIPWINSSMPNRKTDTNNRLGFSTDFIGQNYTYPEASYEERERIIEAHRNYQKGLMWTLANHPRIPDNIKEEVSRWGTTGDEYEREDGWQQQLYIREARRMISDYVMTQHHAEGIEEAEDAVGLAAYGMDSHHVQRYIDANGYVQNEGNVQSEVEAPYSISYRSIIPREEEAVNLLVPVCLSATHIAFGSIRMEPVFMVLGQSAATAASIAIDDRVNLQEVEYSKLRSQLLEDKQRLTNTNLSEK
ncbi:FAD-dependent oxidoreductase [Zunongwangia sp. F260]|uniref:FAD-dependent oxidoreductase n=1 Tax=Autumnicola lenta TaxID=3075593 RepID=A0ABU3CP35_9FLAO|nr:FAD-dependent oxidoreductase [Zunongwangia sp. F260]MDT0647997.1 FAD-dependent oxidoreductase [Zunongwangia sp. F260]